MDGIRLRRNLAVSSGLRVRSAYLTFLRSWHYEVLCRGVCHSGWRRSGISRRSGTRV